MAGAGDHILELAFRQRHSCLAPEVADGRESVRCETAREQTRRYGDDSAAEREGDHVLLESAIGVQTMVLAAMEQLGTRLAQRESLADHVPLGAAVRPVRHQLG